MGSCFAEYIGGYLAGLQFQQLINPFGIIYQPLVMARLIARLLDAQPVNDPDLFLNQGIWRHFDFHSRFASADKALTLDTLNHRIQQAAAHLRLSNRLILTWGTAYAYQHTSTGQWVNNCHKMPANLFLKQRTKVEDIISAYTSLLHRLKEAKPDLQIVLTVSPVRHLRDGILENQRSKAILLLAAEYLTDTFDFVHYFPSYEIIMDELRDYRFYAQDMVHPSDLAVSILRERFLNACCTTDTLALCNRIANLQKNKQHTILHPDSQESQRFANQWQEEEKRLKELLPHLNWD
ncbi:MAG: GSCFA domain-containing protein [Saprospiraceae bacterium]